MRERGFIAQQHEIPGILDGSMTRFRRLIKPQPKLIEPSGRWYWEKALDINGNPLTDASRKWWQYYGTSPYGQPGDHLWVRETFVLESNQGVESPDVYPPPFNDGRPVLWDECPDDGRYWLQPHYRATDPEPELAYEDLYEPGCRWSPSVHMRRWASRATVEVTSVLVDQKGSPWEWVVDFRRIEK